MVVRTNYMVMGTKLYGCRNKNLFVMRTNEWLYEQKQMVVGTKTYYCRNKNIF
jgi:hypothetical protein